MHCSTPTRSFTPIEVLTEGGPDRERELPDEAFRGAYDGWAVAREHAYAEWMDGTDPAKLAPVPPASFKDASRIIMEHGGHLGDRQFATLRRLNSVPSAKARKAMRAAVRDAENPDAQIEGILRVLDEFGIQEAEKVEPLPMIDIEDIRLVAWMAVRGTKVSPD